MMRLLIHMVIWAVVLTVAGQVVFSAMDGETPGPNQPPADATRTAAASPAGFAGDEIVIDRDVSGQFHLTVRINGEDVPFLVDTGASVVALTVEEAERLGLAVGPEDFRPVMRTASGVGNGAPVRLERIELGGREFHGVDAVVVEGLPVNLLGQSLLRRLGGVELQADRMVIRAE